MGWAESCVVAKNFPLRPSYAICKLVWNNGMSQTEVGCWIPGKAVTVSYGLIYRRTTKSNVSDRVVRRILNTLDVQTLALIIDISLQVSDYILPQRGFFFSRKRRKKRKHKLKVNESPFRRERCRSTSFFWVVDIKVAEKDAGRRNNCLSWTKANRFLVGQRLNSANSRHHGWSNSDMLARAWVISSAANPQRLSYFF